MYFIFALKLCVKYTEPGNRARYSPQGVAMEMFSQHMGKKEELVTSIH
jgi:hypothetical protein